MNFKLLLVPTLFSTIALAQTKPDSTKTEEEDFSMYAEVVEAPSNSKTKVYCSQKIVGLSPSKLISFGGDFVAAHTLGVDTINNYANNTTNLLNNTGVRFAANFPVISNNKMILSLGVNYLDFKYGIANTSAITNPLPHALSKTGLRSYGVNGTLFKPFNAKMFGIVQFAADHNSASYLNEFNAKLGLKYSGAIIIGWKPHERLQYGFGVSQTYRGGSLNYLPVVLYNYTFKNKKCGIEMLLPARANFRYTINPRNLLFAGLEFEGNSYYMKPMITDFNLGSNNLQLHRSEIRPRITYEFRVHNFIWMSLQAGYRISYKFNIDDVATDTPPLIMENKLAGAPYVNISLNLVSP
ncbi:MAG: DUF6268 family outer membrane beta-barrel protein [Bacteroidia bacterium]